MPPGPNGWKFTHSDAAVWVADEPADVASCIGATWIGEGFANPDDELAAQMRTELHTEPARYLRYRRECLGWGVFALLKREITTLAG